MKNLLISLILAAIILTTLTSAISCLTSSEEYASEVVIQNYNLENLRKIVQPTNNEYIYSAQYDPKIITIIEETGIPEGLSIRLQIPTEIKEIREPRIKLVSQSSTGRIRKDLLDNFAGWDIFCSEDLCVLDRNDVVITIREVTGKQEVTVEIRDRLEECSDSCTGVCFSTTESSKCLDSKTRNDINILFRYANISNRFEDLLDSYKIVGSEEISITDIQPKINPYIDWQEAMRQELVFLTSRQVLNIKRDEIEKIAALSRNGQAGRNYRIVFDFEDSMWKYYDKIFEPLLTSKRDCKAYSSLETKKVLDQDNQKILFYTIPLLILAAGLIFILILIIIAKSITARRK